MLKVVIKADLTKCIVDTIDAQDIFPEISLENILTAVSYELGIPIISIKSKSRKKELVDARKLYCYLSRDYTKKSLAKIGILINCDHASVLFAIRKARVFIESKGEIEFTYRYNSVKERLNLK